MLRWLHINLCKWRLWLYFHRASKEGITGLLPEKERKKAANVEKIQPSTSTVFDFKPENQHRCVIIQHISRRTDLPCGVKKKKKERLSGIKKILGEGQKMKTLSER